MILVINKSKLNSFELTMPKMGESITEGTIINWLIKEGDSFEEGDIILEVATDKVDNEVPAPACGKLVKTLFEAKDVVPVGEVIALLEVSDAVESSKKQSTESKQSNSLPSKKKTTKKPKTAQPVVNSISNSFSVNNTNTFFSPLTISIAKAQHISFEELARIPATGKDGRLR